MYTEEYSSVLVEQLKKDENFKSFCALDPEKIFSYKNNVKGKYLFDTRLAPWFILEQYLTLGKEKFEKEYNDYSLQANTQDFLYTSFFVFILKEEKVFQ